MIKCMVCNKSFKIISYSHLKRHDMTFDEYKTQFPDAPIVDKEVSQKLSESASRLNKDGVVGFKKEHKINSGKTPWNKGLNKDVDERIKTQAEQLCGRFVSDETKAKISVARKRFCREHPDAIRGVNNGMYGKHLSEKHKKALLESQCFNTINKVELYALNYLCQYGFQYTGDRKKWFKFKDGVWKNPDFYSKAFDTVIEIYGDYWHRNDNPNDIITKYNDIGIKCIVWWEHEVYDKSIFNIDAIEQSLDIWEYEDFMLEDFNNEWML